MASNIEVNVKNRFKRFLNFNIFEALTLGLMIFTILKLLAPFGLVSKYEVKVNDTGEVQDYILNAQPKATITTDEEGTFKIVDTVEFDRDTIKISVPLNGNRYDKMKFKMNYNPPERIGRISLQVISPLSRLDIPIFNHDLIVSGWSKVENERYTLWQIEDQYSSIQEFFDSPPKSDLKSPIIASENIDIPQNVFIEDYEPSDEYIVYEQAIRARHELYTYIEDEPLDINFFFRDLNGYLGDDDGTIKLFNNAGNLIDFWIVEDDSIADVQPFPSDTLRFVNISKSDLPSGAYKIELDFNDTIISKIETKQKKLVVHKNIFLADNIEYGENSTSPTTLYTNSNWLQFRTDHAFGLQTVQINDDPMDIFERGLSFRYLIDEEQISNLYIPSNDMRIFSDGFYSFTKDSFFNPRPSNTVELNKIANIASYDYVLTRNTNMIELDDGWFSNDFEFDVENWMISEFDTIELQLSIPSLEKQDESIYIGDLEISLSN